MKNVVLSIFFLAFGTLTHSQGVIRGFVFDEFSEQPLPGVAVYLLAENSNLGVFTEEDGSFRLEGVPLGRHTIEFSFISYESYYASNVLVSSGKEVELNITLQEKINELEEIVISATKDKHKAINELATVSARSMSVEEMTRYSGTLGDPARMAQSFAGVSGASDDRNDIIVRGNSPTGILWRMEGVDIPSPNHFSTLGNTGGPVSMLNINNLQNSDFLTSAFPSEYGNATSGVFDLKLRNGNSDKHEYLGQIGFNGFELGAEGPISREKNSSFLVNYRYSTLGVFSALGIDFGTGDAVPDYQDVTFKVNLPTKKLGTFSIWGVGGLSDITFLAEDNGENNLFNDDNENSDFESNTAFGGISHTYFLSDNSYSKLNLTYATTSTNGGVERRVENDLFESVFGLKNKQDKFSANWKINSKINAKNKVVGGIIFDHILLNLQDSSKEEFGAEWERRLDVNESTQLVQAYGHWQHRMSEKMTLNLGIHAQYLSFNDDFAIEPRLGWQYKIDDKQNFNLGIGMHSQMQPLTVYFQEGDSSNQLKHPNQNLNYFKSIHGVIGYDRLISNNLRIKTEAYIQYLYDVAVDQESSSFSLVNSGADFGFPSRTNLDNDGIGMNYGVEVTLEKFFSNNYYFLLTGSLFDSRYQGSDEVWRNTLFNSNYTVNFLGGREWKLGQKSAFTFDFKLTTTGGRRYTPIDIEASKLAEEEVLFQELAFSERYKSYFRVDIKPGIRIEKSKATHKFFLDLQNVSGNKNIFIREYDSERGEISTTYQRGFFPDIRYQILF